jgi:hypothetical protein
VPEWEKLRAYTRCVSIPLSIGAQLIATGKVGATGAVIREVAFDPLDVFAELERRKILIHQQIHLI